MISKVPVPTPPSPDVLELLIRARLLLGHAVSHADNPVGVDSLVAIHGLDNVVEFTLRILSGHLDFEVVSGSKFPQSELRDMAGTLDKFLVEQYSLHLPYTTEIQSLRQVRNLVQHGSIDPGADLRRFVTIAERFFSRVTTMIFGLDTSELRISRIVRTETIRLFLEEAEQTLADRKYLGSIVACRDAFDNALFIERSGFGLRFWAATASARVPERDSDTPAFFQVVAEELEAARLRIHSARLQRFQEIVEEIPGEHRADLLGYRVPNRTFTLDDARYCYSFVTEYILRWQSEHFVSAEPPSPTETTASSRRTRWYLNETELPHHPGTGYVYHPLDGKFYMACVSPEVRDALWEIRPGSVCRWREEVWENGALITDVCHDAKLVQARFHLATHRPPRWEICLFLQQVPFTWRSRDYSPDGSVVHDSISINASTAEEIADLDRHIIGPIIAERVVARRNAIGEIRSIDDLRTIEGITEQQLEWLADFTRL